MEFTEIYFDTFFDMKATILLNGSEEIISRNIFWESVNSQFFHTANRVSFENSLIKVKKNSFFGRHFQNIYDNDLCFLQSFNAIAFSKGRLHHCSVANFVYFL